MSIITRALVTGANGFIGSNLCAALRRQGIATRGLILPGTDAKEIATLGVEVVEADITKPLAAAGFTGVSHVFHLAAIPLDWGPLELFMRVNFQGTQNVLDAAVAAGAIHFVHMSSLAVHPYTGYSNGDENTPRGWKINGYTITKNLTEDFLQSQRERIMVTVIRPGIMPYGPGDRLSMPGILDAITRGIYRHVGGGKTRMCVSYVGNLADGMILAAQREGASGEAYILADETVTWRELLDTIADVFGKPTPQGSIPFALAFTAAVVMETVWRVLPLKGVPMLTRYRIDLFRGDLVFSSAKARRELGYAPAVTLREGLKRTREWYLKQDIISE